MTLIFTFLSSLDQCQNSSPDVVYYPPHSHIYHNRNSLHTNRYCWMEADRVSTCLAIVGRIQEALNNRQEERSSYLTAARSVLSSIDQSSFLGLPSDSKDRRWIIEVLQRLAFHEADVGPVSDIADWCLRQWLSLLQDDAQSIAVLQRTCALKPPLECTKFARHRPILVIESATFSCENTPC